MTGRGRIGGIALGILLATAGTAGAVEFELKNDSFVAEGAVYFQLGFIPNEIGASRFVPPTAGSYQVKGVTFLFGGATTTQTVTLHVWLDSGGATPGTEVYTADYSLTGADDALQLIDLTAESVFVTGTFRIGLEFHHPDLPSIARDDDGIMANRNFMYICLDPPGCSSWPWVASETAGLTGDWVIRAIVDGDPGALPDAGVSQPDAAVPLPDGGAGAPDAGSGAACEANSQCPTGEYCNPSGVCTFDCRTDDDCGTQMTCSSLGQCVEAGGDGGCGCRATGRGADGWVALLVVLFLGLRRRRASGLHLAKNM